MSQWHSPIIEAKDGRERDQIYDNNSMFTIPIGSYLLPFMHVLSQPTKDKDTIKNRPAGYISFRIFRWDGIHLVEYGKCRLLPSCCAGGRREEIRILRMQGIFRMATISIDCIA